MRISIRGWKRDHGAKSLVSAELKEMKIVKEPGLYLANTTYLMAKRDANNDIQGFVVSKRVTDFVANGNYQANIEISKEEVLALAHRFIKNMTAEELGRYTLEGV